MKLSGLKRFIPAITGVALIGGFITGGMMMAGIFSADTVAATTEIISPESSKVHPPRLGRTVSGNYLAGRQAQILRDYNAASSFYEAVLTKEQSSFSLVQQAMIVALLVGDMDKAQILAERVVQATPDEQISNLVLTINDFKALQFDDAVTRLEGLKNEGITAFVKPALLAWAKVGSKQSSENILASLKPLANKKGTAFFADLHTALIDEFLNDIPAAQKAFTKLMDNAEGVSLRTLQHVGEFHERQGDVDQAKEIYQQFMKNQPASGFFGAAFLRLENKEKPQSRVSSVVDGASEILFGISNLLSQQNAKDMALIVSHLGLYLKSEFPALQYLHASTLDDASRSKEALLMFQMINEGGNPSSEYRWESRLRSVAILDNLGREDEAIVILKQMISERLDDPDALISLGNLFRHHERYQEAVTAYDSAIERIGKIDTRDWNLLYVRGIALERAKIWDRAEADFLKALELEPDQPHVMNYLGYSWVEKGVHLDEAQEMIEKAVAKRPNDGFIVDSLGWVYYRLGQYESAVLELERAVEIRPQDAVINDHLGDAYWRVGRKLEAVFQWSRALNLEPDEDVLRVIEDKLENGMGAPESLPKQENKLTSETAIQG